MVMSRQYLVSESVEEQKKERKQRHLRGYWVKHEFVVKRTLKKGSGLR